MELGQRLKDLRNINNISQEELADKIYVSRQTVSSWENDKSYPDIHSLLMLSELFGVSLDDLVKGDIEKMKEKIDQNAIYDFKKDSNIFALLMFVCVVSVIPLFKYLKVLGIIIWAIIAILMLYYAKKVEDVKKKNDIYTYKEIVAFTNGEKLDGIEKAREEGKRNYQRVIMLLLGALAGLIVAIIISEIMKYLPF